MTRQSMEKYQVLIYLAAIACGLLIGTMYHTRVGFLETLLWPVLGFLLYATFTQVPLGQMRTAIKNVRFLTAAVTGNFLIVPLIVYGLVYFLPDDPAVRLGVLMVLLVPCTDWFITFTHLGGGDTNHAIAFAPISLLLQIFLLPVYLLVFLGPDLVVSIVHRDMFYAFAGLILLPLLLAHLTQRWHRLNSESRVIDILAWLPVPLLAIVVLMVAASQVTLVSGSLGLIGHLTAIYSLYLVIALLLARILTTLFHLPVLHGRVLAFSLGSRNSFIVLPLALALPSSFDVAIVAVVYQSLVELCGMLIYLWVVPKQFFRE